MLAKTAGATGAKNPAEIRKLIEQRQREIERATADLAALKRQERASRTALLVWAGAVAMNAAKGDVAFQERFLDALRQAVEVEERRPKSQRSAKRMAGYLAEIEAALADDQDGGEDPADAVRALRRLTKPGAAAADDGED